MATTFAALEAAGGNEFRDEFELLKQGVVKFSTALVGGEFLMPVGGRFQRVPGYQK